MLNKTWCLLAMNRENRFWNFQLVVCLPDQGKPGNTWLVSGRAGRRKPVPWEHVPALRITQWALPLGVGKFRGNLAGVSKSRPLFLAARLAQPRDSVNNRKWTSLWMSGPSPFLVTKSSLFGCGLWDHFFIWAPMTFASWMLTWHFSCAALLGCYRYDILFLQLNVIFFKVRGSCLVLRIYSL